MANQTATSDQKISLNWLWTCVPGEMCQNVTYYWSRLRSSQNLWHDAKLKQKTLFDIKFW